jgi:hypothetical protein
LVLARPVSLRASPAIDPFADGGLLHLNVDRLDYRARADRIVSVRLAIVAGRQFTITIQLHLAAVFGPELVVRTLYTEYKEWSSRLIGPGSIEIGDL